MQSQQRDGARYSPFLKKNLSALYTKWAKILSKPEYMHYF
jgi:hypothetical protein